MDSLTQHDFQPEIPNDNPEPRCAVVLVLDTSGSMSGAPIAALKEGLRRLAGSLRENALTRLRVELALITFGGIVRVHDFGNRTFVSPDEFNPPELEAMGNTPMGLAVRKALELLQQRKSWYKQQGLDYFRPWLLLITDGEPTDADWETVANAARQEESRKGVLIFPIGVEGANFNKLAKFSAERSPLKLNGLAFEELFQWVSNSLSAIASSRPEEQTSLTPITGWATVQA